MRRKLKRKTCSEKQEKAEKFKIYMKEKKLMEKNKFLPAESENLEKLLQTI